MVQYRERLVSLLTFAFGNVGRTTNVFSPGIINFDTSLFKNMIFHERFTLQFRAEFFNLFNRANFGPPDTTDWADKTFGQISALQFIAARGAVGVEVDILARAAFSLTTTKNDGPSYGE